MSEFDESERRKEEEARAKHNVPDEDGFVTVQRVHRRGTNRAGEITVTAVPASVIKQKEEKPMINFYSFQERSKKMEGRLSLIGISRC